MGSVPTFPQQLQPPTIRTDASPAEPLQAAPESAAVAIRALARQLGKTERQQLLAELFAEDLTVLVASETAKGFQQGEQQGKVTAAKQAETELLALRTALEQQSSGLETLLKSLSASDLAVHCDDKRMMLDWCLAAIEKVLLHECRDQAYLQATLELLLAQAGSDTELVLHCHPAEQALLQAMLPSNCRLKACVADPALAIGQLRLGTAGIRSTGIAERISQLSTVATQMAAALTAGPAHD